MTDKEIPPAKESGTQNAIKPVGINGEARPGNGSGVDVEKVSFAKNKPESWSNLLLVIAYAVQSRGTATVNDICEYLTALGVRKLNQNSVSDGVSALQKQDILAVGQSASGEQRYSMKRVKFNCNPEVATVGALIQVLRADSTGQLIVEMFKKGDTKEQPWPKKPHDFAIRFRLLDDIAGSQIWSGNPRLQQRYFAAPNNHTLHQKNGKGIVKDKNGDYVLKPEFVNHLEIPMMFDRWFDGRIVAAHPGTLRGFFRTAVGAIAMPCERTITAGDVDRFFSFEALLSNAVLETQKAAEEVELSMTKLPVMRSGFQNKGGEGAVPKNYETIPAGTELTLFLTMPTEHFIKPEELKKWLAVALKRNPGFFSPARGRQMGAAELISVHTKPTFEEKWSEVA